MKKSLMGLAVAIIFWALVSSCGGGGGGSGGGSGGDSGGSYQCEPFAIASTLFKYFGVQNPQELTGETAIDESTDVPNEWI